MKAKDIRTIKSLINEYGMQSGVSTPVGNQESGATAKQSAANKTNSSPTTNKPSQSPTTTQNPNPVKPEQPEAPKMTKASELKKDFEFADDKGDAVKVISPVGQGKNKDALIVQNQKSKEYYAMQPDDEVELPVEESSSKIKKMLSKKQRKTHLNKKIKKLVRKHNLREQGKELIFEINFNDPKIAKQALDLPIKCGFEAETAWDHVGDNGEGDDWIDEYNWYDIEDFINDQEGSSSVRSIENSYDEWISEKAMDLEGDFVWEIVGEREEDENYINDYIDQEISEDDIEEYKERILDDLPEEDQEEYEDWDFMNWGRQYVEEELLDEYKEWLADGVRDEGEAMDRAYEQATSDYDKDEWARYEYGSWASTLAEHGIYLSNPDGEGRGVHEVGEFLEDWASEQSAFRGVQAGEYHSSYGTNNDYWRVETDSSIDAYGTGAEIISPVYTTPRKMLGEMKKLFSWLDDQGAETNSSCGLHVTMSLDSEEKEEVNPVKLAVLLGDKYLLSTFGRERNSYAKSQMANLQKAAAKLKADPNNTKNIKAIEKILSSGVMRDKFTSINFKDQKDNDTGNQLIEFRIGGGNDYHTEFDKAAKAVIRYAITMQSAHSDKLYSGDYAKALFRMLRKIDEIDPDTEERAKGDIEHPAIDILKGFYNKENYIESVHLVTRAFDELEEYKKASHPDADKKWKQQIKDYEKGTGRRFDIKEVEEGEPIQGYMEPSKVPPSKYAQAHLLRAQDKFIRAIAQAGYDLSQNLNRTPVTAKGIGILRKTIDEFQLTYNKIADKMQGIEKELFTGEGRSEVTPKQLIGRVKSGVDKLFKKDVVREPAFLTAPQVERAIQGMWNAVQSDEIKDGNTAKDFVRTLAGIMGGKKEHEDYAARWLDELRGRGANREYKEFHSKILRGSYGEKQLLAPGEPVDIKAYKRFMDHLKQYPEWNHPVAKGHNPTITGDDDYQTNATAKMMQKLRMRWEHLEDIREENPGQYIDSIREIAKITQKLVDATRTSDADTMSDTYPDLRDTDHHHNRDGETYFGLSKRRAEDLQNVIDNIEQPDPFGEAVAHKLRDHIQSYLAGCFERYYSVKKRENPGYYKMGSLPELIKKRTDAIKNFLEDFDKINQKLGFDSQQSAIDKKLKLDKKQAKFNKKHGPTNLVKVDGWDFGGDIFITKGVADNLSDGYTDRELANILTFDSGVHKSNQAAMLRIPSAHYFTAKDAMDVLDNERYTGTWREPIAREVLQKFRDIYGTPYQDLDKYYVNINDYRIKDKLMARGVEFTDDLGDGRIGMGDYGPLLDVDRIEGPHGEPFSSSAAASWRVNNPKLAKKVDADDEKRRNSIDVQIPKAAGVEGMERDSSSGIANATNWNNLAKYLKIEAGVNDQGVNLLKKAYNQFDSNHNWRPEPDPDVCCMPRYVAAVKAAKEYIEKNYQVSGGNYFRLNADGSKGDDVSGVHGSNDPTLGEIDSVELTDTSYAEARGDYEKFDGMMQNGMQNYMAQTDVNRLVKFLVGDFSEKYKRAVLHSLIVNKSNGGEPADIQQALALGKRILGLNPQFEGRNNMESVFNKFDKLPLEEQLILLAKVDNNKINEAWSKKYKDSINCSNPKGFSQKAHCDGKKKKKVKESALPANDRVSVIKHLLSDSLLASDLQKQFWAYWAVPVPAMLDSFREARAMGGDKVDLRQIFKGFVNSSVHPEEKKKIGLKESVLKEDRDKERFEFIIDKLKQHPEFIQRVYRFIRTDVKNSERVHPQDFLQPERTAPEQDYAYKGVLPEFVKAIMNTDGDFDDIENFLATYGKQSYINTKVLMADGSATWDQWLQGGKGVSVEFISELYDNLFNVALNIEGSNRGPGEVGLALLSPNITFASVGDLKIDGVEVEVKGEKSSGGGRLKNSNADYGAPDLNSVYNKFKIPQEDRPTFLPRGNAGSRPGTHFLDIATQLDTLAAGAGQAYIEELFRKTFINGDKNMINYMVKNYAKMDRTESSTLAGEISYSSYANILKAKEFDMFLFLKAPGKKSLTFKVDDYKNHLDKFKLGSLDWGDKQNGPAVQVSMR